MKYLEQNQDPRTIYGPRTRKQMAISAVLKLRDKRRKEQGGMMKMPEVYRYMTADECAECVDYWSHLKNLEDGCGMRLYSKLWDFKNGATKSTPLGGDGSNGTVECPQDLEYGNDTGPHWWGVLNDEEKEALIKAGGE